MWRFLPNVKPPPKKKSAEDKKEANRRYEKELREKKTFKKAGKWTKNGSSILSQKSAELEIERIFFE